MPLTRVNLNGIHELDLVLEDNVTAVLTAPGVVTVTQNNLSNTHDELLTDGNGNTIYSATLTWQGNVIVVTGVPN